MKYSVQDMVCFRVVLACVWRRMYLQATITCQQRSLSQSNQSEDFTLMLTPAAEKLLSLPINDETIASEQNNPKLLTNPNGGAVGQGSRACVGNDRCLP